MDNVIFILIILGAIFGWSILNLMCVVASRLWIRFFVVLLFSTAVVVGSFWGGLSFGSMRTQNSFYGCARRDMAFAFSNLAEVARKKEYESLARKVDVLNTRWNETVFFREESGFEERGYPKLILELDK
jgi:hypothetical protein